MCILIVEALHGKDGHVVAAAGVQRAGELPSTIFHLIRPLDSFLDVIFIVDAATADYYVQQNVFMIM